MNRRKFLGGMAASYVAARSMQWGSLANAAGVAARQDRRFLLSKLGCGRASGYAEANKIVTVDNKTHVSWLDSPPEGFRVRVRTLDRLTGEWSPTYTVGEAYDNHGGPALTVDSDGFLHIVYYPHHNPMRYRKSRRPNDASEWEEEVQFGQRCTYPTLVCGADNTLYFTCRRSFSDKPYQVELWTKSTGESWTGPMPILQSRYKGYAHFQESLVWSPDHQALHLCCRFHEHSDKEPYGRLQTIAYMVSPDFGRTWLRSDGKPIKTPASVDNIEVLARGGVDHDRILRAGAMAADRGGTPYIIYSSQEESATQTILATPQEGGVWRRQELSQHLPQSWQSYSMIMAGGVTYSQGGEMVIVAQVQRITPDEQSWGHSTNEVISFRSSDGGRMFRFNLASEPDEATSHWLPNIERPTGHNLVPDQPSMLYTAGPPGAKNTELLSNRVYWTTV